MAEYTEAEYQKYLEDASIQGGLQQVQTMTKQDMLFRSEQARIQNKLFDVPVKIPKEIKADLERLFAVTSYIIDIGNLTTDDMIDFQNEFKRIVLTYRMGIPPEHYTYDQHLAVQNTYLMFKARLRRAREGFERQQLNPGLGGIDIKTSGAERRPGILGRFFGRGRSGS